MKHRIKVSVSKAPDPNGVVAAKRARFRDSTLRKLFGTTDKTVLVLGGSVCGISIQEVGEPGKEESHGTHE